mgnify:CR=1 FL=1
MAIPSCHCRFSPNSHRPQTFVVLFQRLAENILEDKKIEGELAGEGLSEPGPMKTTRKNPRLLGPAPQEHGCSEVHHLLPGCQQVDRLGTGLFQDAFDFGPGPWICQVPVDRRELEGFEMNIGLELTEFSSCLSVHHNYPLQFLRSHDPEEFQNGLPKAAESTNYQNIELARLLEMGIEVLVEEIQGGDTGGVENQRG